MNFLWIFFDRKKKISERHLNTHTVNSGFLLRSIVCNKVAGTLLLIFYDEVSFFFLYEMNDVYGTE